MLRQCAVNFIHMFPLKFVCWLINQLYVAAHTHTLLLLLLLYAVTHAPFHAPVLRPTSWPNARDRRDGEVN